MASSGMRGGGAREQGKGDTAHWPPQSRGAHRDPRTDRAEHGTRRETGRRQATGRRRPHRRQRQGRPLRDGRLLPRTRITRFDQLLDGIG